MNKIENALKEEFSLHDVYYIMNLLYSFSSVEDDYIDESRGKSDEA